MEAAKNETKDREDDNEAEERFVLSLRRVERWYMSCLSWDVICYYDIAKGRKDEE